MQHGFMALRLVVQQKSAEAISGKMDFGKVLL
jgi:hypothetical protein